MKSFDLGLTAVVVLLCAGCMVGPDYSEPSVPMTAAYKEDQGWKLARPLDHIPRGKWWEVFGDPQLNALEEQVSQANQNVKVAEAHFRQARAMIGIIIAKPMEPTSAVPFRRSMDPGCGPAIDQPAPGPAKPASGSKNSECVKWQPRS